MKNENKYICAGCQEYVDKVIFDEDKDNDFCENCINQDVLNQHRLQAIKEKSNLFAEQMKNEISEFCNQLDYKQSGVFSFNIDRLERFISELNEFELKN